MGNTSSRSGSKTKILDAAMYVIRAKGYADTSVDDLCAAAGVTKGCFFHYFKSKEELAVEAAGHFSAMAEGLFSAAPFTELADPVDRLLAYVDFRIAILKGELPEFTCLLGTMVQETDSSHPAIRDACAQYMGEHIDMLVRDIDLARESRRLDVDWTSSSLGFHIQAVIQGSFIFAKAEGGTSHAIDCLKHLRRYLETLFNHPHTRT
jgi:TetR/AcrR family transcriptional repressor of nem operon